VNDPERDPFKTLILGMCFCYAPVALIWFNRIAGGTLRSFPHPFGHLFLVGLFFTTGMSLYGVVRQQSVRGVLWERAGMWGLAPLFFTYGLWAVSALGVTASGFASLLIALGLAAIVRVSQINRRQGRGWGGRRRRRAVGGGDP
jgi:hypothetical protein